MASDRRELIRGRHVSLRLMEESDAPHIVAWRNRPDTTRWLTQWEPLTIESHLAWMESRRQAGDLLLMYDALDGAPVAMTSLQDFDRPKTSAEWGRLVAASIGRNGHAILEGCYLLHRMLFGALGMFRLIGAVPTTNERPYRLYRFLGYRKEGVRRKHWVHSDGTYFDVIEIGVFEEEFEAARSEVEAKLYPDGSLPELGPDRVALIRERVPLSAPAARPPHGPAARG